VNAVNQQPATQANSSAQIRGRPTSRVLTVAAKHCHLPCAESGNPSILNRLAGLDDIQTPGKEPPQIIKVPDSWNRYKIRSNHQKNSSIRFYMVSDFLY
jgi:hypothetical protein